MKQIDFPVELIGPTGDREAWTFTTEPLKADYGRAHWINHKLSLNSRLRDRHNILYTLLHEVAHVTGGQNISEEFCVNFEHNVKTICQKLGLVVDFEKL